ncbi:MAG: hypothetical protein WB801_09330 [Candidatus Dormiibacterota bacterium]
MLQLNMTPERSELVSSLGKQRDQEVFDLYRREIELANAVIAATPLDAAPA